MSSFQIRNLSISHTPHLWEPEYESLEPVDWEGSDDYLSSEIKVFDDQQGVSQLGIAMSESRIAESMSRTREIDAQKVQAVEIYKENFKNTGNFYDTTHVGQPIVAEPVSRSRSSICEKA